MAITARTLANGTTVFDVVEYTGFTLDGKRDRKTVTCRTEKEAKVEQAKIVAMRDAMRNRSGRMKFETMYIEPGSPWENGYCESFNARMRDEFLSLELFETWYEVEVLTKEWIHHYNFERPHSSLGYKPPAIQAKVA